jgi:hypothetical protein
MPPSAEAGAIVPLDCAQVAAQFLWAEITGNKDKSALYAGELKDSWWKWRMKPGDLRSDDAARLREFARLYDR